MTTRLDEIAPTLRKMFDLPEDIEFGISLNAVGPIAKRRDCPVAYVTEERRTKRILVWVVDMRTASGVAGDPPTFKNGWEDVRKMASSRHVALSADVLDHEKEAN